jgi:hypothetical protein
MHFLWVKSKKDRTNDGIHFTAKIRQILIIEGEDDFYSCLNFKWQSKSRIILLAVDWSIWMD